MRSLAELAEPPTDHAETELRRLERVEGERLRREALEATTRRIVRHEKSEEQRRRQRAAEAKQLREEHRRDRQQKKSNVVEWYRPQCPKCGGSSLETQHSDTDLPDGTSRQDKKCQDCGKNFKLHLKNSPKFGERKNIF